MQAHFILFSFFRGIKNYYVSWNPLKFLLCKDKSIGKLYIISDFFCKWNSSNPLNFYFGLIFPSFFLIVIIIPYLKNLTLLIRNVIFVILQFGPACIVAYGYEWMGSFSLNTVWILLYISIINKVLPSSQKRKKE